MRTVTIKCDRCGKDMPSGAFIALDDLPQDWRVVTSKDIRTGESIGPDLHLCPQDVETFFHFIEDEIPAAPIDLAEERLENGHIVGCHCRYVGTVECR